MSKFVEITGGVTSPKGYKATGVAAGIKPGRNDMAAIFSEAEATAAACFTKNAFKAAPIVLCMENIKGGKARAAIINAGNANACTGFVGLNDAKRMAQFTAELLEIPAEEVIVASTGVIGQNLPMDKIEFGIKAAVNSLSSDGGNTAARAIMTTDLAPKEVAVVFEIGGKTVTIGGMAKGSGMIHPNMATMLGFLTCDAVISSFTLQKALSAAVETSYNMITVDGDTSTNDMVSCFANGLAGNPEIFDGTDEFQLFSEAMAYVNTKLAKMIAKDGEGATKLLEIKIINAPDYNNAVIAAKSVASSSLVKTAFYGEDANWGRIYAALGYSGADLGEMNVDVTFISENGTIKLAENGAGINFDEDFARKVLQAAEIEVLIDLKNGDAAATAWTCDLSYDYIKINASYRS